MLQAVYTKQFEKDMRLSQKRGKQLEKLKPIIETLLESKRLPLRNRDHALSGEYSNRRECHIEPDWLLIYLPLPKEGQIIFERMGTHADLFK